MKAYRPSEVVVNNTLFIDKTENAVGINTMTPKYNLDVVGKINCSDDLSVGGVITVAGGLSLTNIAASGNLTVSGNTPTSGNILAGRNVTASGNIGIGVTNPTNRLNIASDVPYANLTSASLRTTAQLHIKQATGTGSLYIANGYSGGVGTGSVIQTSDYYDGSDHGTTLFLNPLGGSVNFGSASVNFGSSPVDLGSGVVTFSLDKWHKSSDGKNRLYFANNSTTYLGSGNGWFTFQNPSGTNTLTLDNAGNFTVTGNATISSDARLKTNIVEIDSPLEKIKNMRGVYYNRIDDSNVSPARHVGVIAQEVERVLPEVVLTDTSEAKHKSVAYGNIVALLIEGMKAQQSTIEGMQAILSSRT
jgi:hypothetical protein